MNRSTLARTIVNDPVAASSADPRALVRRVLLPVVQKRYRRVQTQPVRSILRRLPSRPSPLAPHLLLHRVDERVQQTTLLLPQLVRRPVVVLPIPRAIDRTQQLPEHLLVTRPPVVLHPPLQRLLRLDRDLLLVDLKQHRVPAPRQCCPSRPSPNRLPTRAPSGNAVLSRIHNCHTSLRPMLAPQ